MNNRVFKQCQQCAKASRLSKIRPHSAKDAHDISTRTGPQDNRNSSNTIINCKDIKSIRSHTHVEKIRLFVYSKAWRGAMQPQREQAKIRRPTNTYTHTLTHTHTWTYKYTAIQINSLQNRRTRRSKTRTTTRKHIDTEHAHTFAYKHIHTHTHVYYTYYSHVHTHTPNVVGALPGGRVVIAKLEPHTNKV